MNTEIARQIREGVSFGKAWAFAAHSGTPSDFLEASQRRFRAKNGKLATKAMERTLRKAGIVKHRGMYFWWYNNEARM